MLRPCADRARSFADEKENSWEPRSHIDENGRDRDWTKPGWTASRCGGICDAEIGSCFCDGKYKYIPAPTGSRPGTPPVQPGRGLGDHCIPATTKDGRKAWGSTPYDQLYGERGWCEAEHPVKSCGCLLDGWHGRNCNERSEQYCVNQCTGHGTCHLGFCMCDEGWYVVRRARQERGS